MNRKKLAFLKLGLICLLIAVALLNLAIANWAVGIVILALALLTLYSEQQLKRLKEERTVLREEFSQQMQLINELMRYPLSEPPPSSYICRQCKYFHGRSGVVCAVHPEGSVGNECGDFEGKS